MTVQTLLVAVSVRAIGWLELTFTNPPTTTRRPVTGIQESVPLVAGLEFDLHAELVLVGGHCVCHGRVVESFKNFFRAGAPSFVPRSYVGWGLVVGLQEVACIAVGGEVFDGELFVLAPGL